jgi:hypothetical protein
MSGSRHEHPVCHVLLEAAPAGLADWYATPLTPRQAQALQEEARREIQRRLRNGTSGFQPGLLVMICQWWLRPQVHGLFEELRHVAASGHERALLHLVYGQLLASRRLSAAGEQLATGFRHAAALLGSAEYFRLLRRHEMLGLLGLGSTPGAGCDLPELLAEAAVIERLQRGRRPGVRDTGHRDTLG